MNKNEFLQKLKEDLSSLSDEERLNAIKYYEEYFADAEENKDSDNITECVSPEDLADRIREEIAEMDTNQTDEKSENFSRAEETEKSEENNTKEETKWQYKKNIYNQGNMKKNNTLKIILIICAAPILIPIFIGVGCVAFGIFMTLFSIAFAVASIALAGFIMIGAGFMSVGYGITNLFIDMSVALYPIGMGFVVVGVGIIIAYLFTILAAVIFKSQFKFLSWTVRGITNKFSRQGA